MSPRTPTSSTSRSSSSIRTSPRASWPASCARVRLAPARGSSRVASASRSIARRRSMRRCRSAKSTSRASWAPRRVRCNSTRSSPRASAPCAVPTGDAGHARRDDPRESTRDDDPTVEPTATRALALDALIRIEDGAFAHILVPELLARSDLEPRDRAFVTELVYGSVRMQRALDFQLDRHASRPLAELEPAVRAALRLGAYQLLIGTPAHAAVAETVEAVTTRARGFVNGVLRSLARAGPPWSWPPADTVDRHRGAHVASGLDRAAARRQLRRRRPRSRRSP